MTVDIYVRLRVEARDSMFRLFNLAARLRRQPEMSRSDFDLMDSLGRRTMPW